MLHRDATNQTLHRNETEQTLHRNATNQTLHRDATNQTLHRDGTTLSLMSPPFDYTEESPQPVSLENFRLSSRSVFEDDLETQSHRTGSAIDLRDNRRSGIDFSSTSNLHFKDAADMHPRSAEQDAFVINVFDKTFGGLTPEAIEANARSQFQINHSIHLCIMCIPGVNFFWLFVYILHCLGVLQWF